MSVRSRFRWLLILLLLVGGTIAAVGIWFGLREPPVETERPVEFVPPSPDPAPPDPRLTFATPFRNVRPEVRYVGDAACAPCHAEIERTYRAHPMGRSAAFVADAVPIERYDAKANTPFRVDAFELSVEKSGKAIQHRVSARDISGGPLPDYVLPAHVAIGSGAQGRSYLSVQDGCVWQTPLSWFSSREQWDLSPGFEPANRRPIGVECLFCHVNQVQPVPGRLNRYQEPVFAGQLTVGCERCHGPGELHVAERLAGKVPEGRDTSIVNPRHLDVDLRMSVCQQCHLQGLQSVTRRGRNHFEFRPGLPWEQFVTVFVLHPELGDPLRSVGQFEQMIQSRCFTGSQGQLDCTSCHDPHAKPAPEQAAAFYRARCLKCHETQGCALPVAERQAKQDHCVACHMPQEESANVVHASVIDHRIPRRATASKAPSGKLPPGTMPLLPFRPSRYRPPTEELERDTGIALAKVSSRLTGIPLPIPLGLTAREKLKASLTTWPGDAEAWGSLALVHSARAEVPEQLHAARCAVALGPESEGRQVQLRSAAIKFGDLELALQTASRLVEMTPGSIDHRLARSDLFMRLTRWAEAEADCRAALDIHPLDPLARLYLAACRHQQGDPVGALREYETALRLTTKPQVRAAYEHWFRERTW